MLDQQSYIKFAEFNIFVQYVALLIENAGLQFMQATQEQINDFPWSITIKIDAQEEYCKTTNLVTSI